MTTPTTSAEGFYAVGEVSFRSKATSRTCSVSGSTVILAVARANTYLHQLEEAFGQSRLGLYETLGPRNVSGFVGEVVKAALANTVEGFVANPHADGRPDLLDVSSLEARRYLEGPCRDQVPPFAPLRERLAPFRYGGLEVKCTIGALKSNYREMLRRADRSETLTVGTPRRDYICGITYWGHHRDCTNLVGIYYDFVAKAGGAPQVLLVMHAELDPAKDWSPISVGRASSKKTSNTSLTRSGRSKIRSNAVAVTAIKEYQDKFRAMQIALPAPVTQTPLQAEVAE